MAGLGAGLQFRLPNFQRSEDQEDHSSNGSTSNNNNVGLLVMTLADSSDSTLNPKPSTP